MNFTVDEKILAGSCEIQDWTLSKVFLKNEVNYPWFILVPKIPLISEIVELEKKDQYALMDEISRLSHWLKAHFKPDKINVAALGNIVSQLHVHVVGRFKNDPLWPHSIWQPSFVSKPHAPETFKELVSNFKSSKM